MEKPAPRRRAASGVLPTTAVASTNSKRRTASRCTRPMKPVPTTAVLIVFLVFPITTLYPPGSRRLLTDYDTVEKLGRLGQTLLRREQTVFMLDGEYVIVAKHAQGRDKLAPPLRSVTVTASSKDPGAIALLGVQLGIEHAGARQVSRVNLSILGMDVGVDLRGGDVGVAEQALHTAQIGAVLHHVGGATVAQHVRSEEHTSELQSLRHLVCR